MKTNVVKKMKAQFTPEEKEILQGQSGKLAKKHRCSQVYVNLIIRGKREIESKLAKKIYKDMKGLIALLSPDSDSTEPNKAQD